MSDGTTNGTVEIYSHLSPQYLTVVGNNLFFIGSQQTPGNYLWKTDGTTNGTMMIWYDPSSPQGAIGTSLTAVGDTLFFLGYRQNTGVELWKVMGLLLEQYLLQIYTLETLLVICIVN